MMAVSYMKQINLSLHWYHFRYTLNCIRDIHSALVRQDELTQLLRWAQRKRLSGPQRLYRRRLQDEETRLSRYQLQYPRLFSLCCWLKVFRQQVKGRPASYTRGAAAKYRRL